MIVVASAPVAVDFDEEISQVAWYVFLSSDPRKREEKSIALIARWNLYRSHRFKNKKKEAPEWKMNCYIFLNVTAIHHIVHWRTKYIYETTTVTKTIENYKGSSNYVKKRTNLKKTPFKMY